MGFSSRERFTIQRSNSDYFKHFINCESFLGIPSKMVKHLVKIMLCSYPAYHQQEKHVSFFVCQLTVVRLYFFAMPRIASPNKLFW